MYTCSFIFVGVQEVKWDSGGNEAYDDYIYFYGNMSTNHNLRAGFFLRNGIISTVKRVEFVSDIYKNKRQLV
jgi:hypothetical protein